MNIRQKIKSAVVSRFLTYDAEGLGRFLRRLGVRQGDTLMLHSSWQPLNGFSGSPAKFCGALRDYLGPEGLLVMPSLTYHNMSSAEFLATGKPMDVRRSPSAMGLLTEVFRRGKEVRRSLSPTHPLLAWGAEADSFVAGHEATDRPFGPNSPFALLLERNAMLLCLDCGFSSITFTHFVEDSLADTLPFPLYEAEPMVGCSIDRDGKRINSHVRVLSREANQLRREPRLIANLEQAGALKQVRLGNSRFTWIRAADLVAGAQALAENGDHFFDLPAPLATANSTQGC
jgi:aminoglycoside 3-N-acetyltransferase